MKEFQAEKVWREGQTLFGVQKTSTDQRQRTDVPMMEKLYARLTGKTREELRPMYAISWGFDQPGAFTLFVGAKAEADGLNEVRLPAGEWAVIRICSRWRIFRAADIRKAKQWFYTVWLPKHGYEARGMECEERGEDPDAVELMFPVQPQK